MVHIVTDSTCDISKEEQERLNIHVEPLTVRFKDEEYREGVDITTEQFYQKLETVRELPTTAQINPEAMAKVFRQYIEAGEEIVGIFISSAMSGTCQSARIAAEMVAPDKIHVIDSQNVTFGLGLLVYEAVRRRDEGMDAAAIAREIGAIAPRVTLLAAVDTLKYLKMGGRISNASAFVGGILGIVPIITIENGLVKAFGKERGFSAALQTLTHHFQAHPPAKGYTVMFGHTHAPEKAQECRELFAPYMESGVPVHVSSIGCVVGTHAGPGAAGIAYIAGE